MSSRTKKLSKRRRRDKRSKKKFKRHQKKGGQITYSSDKTCVDLIMGTDETILEYLSLDKDNIVFKLPDSDTYICSSRSGILTHMNDPDNIVVACTGVTTALNITPNMVCGLKLAKLKALGIGYDGFVSLKNIVDVVGTKSDSLFEIRDYSNPITVNAIAGLKVLPRFRPEHIQIPFYINEDETLDSFVSRLNKWGEENGQPNLGDRWEESSNLLLGAAHCQAGYEGQRLYRIISNSFPDYEESPSLLDRMLKNGCIDSIDFSSVETDIPMNDTLDEALFYEGAIDSVTKPEESQSNILDNNEIGMSSLDSNEGVEDINTEIKELIKNQLTQNNGLTNILARSIVDTNTIETSERFLLDLDSQQNVSKILDIMNLSSISPSDSILHSPYIFGYVDFDDMYTIINYVIGLNSLFLTRIEEQSSVDIYDFVNRTALKRVLTSLISSFNDKKKEVNMLGTRYPSFDFILNPLQIVIGIRRSEGSNLGKGAILYTLSAQTLLDSLSSNILSSEDKWKQWYKNIISRIVSTDGDETSTVTPEITLLHFRKANDGLQLLTTVSIDEDDLEDDDLIRLITTGFLESIVINPSVIASSQNRQIVNGGSRKRLIIRHNNRRKFAVHCNSRCNCKKTPNSKTKAKTHKYTLKKSKR